MNEELRLDGKNQEAVARATVYRVLAQAFSYPDADRLDFLRDRFAPALKDVVPLLPVHYRQGLSGPAEGMGAAGLSPEGAEEGEYNRLFRTQVMCSPYESEYDPMASTRKGQLMADIAGFYTAFGLKLSESQKELPDHIGVELDFMGLLLQKEAYARLNGWEEKAGICADAARKFLREHLGGWVFSFCGGLEKSAGPGLYRPLAGLLRGFMESELKELGVEPLAFAGPCGPSTKDDFTCPFAALESN